MRHICKFAILIWVELLKFRQFCPPWLNHKPLEIIKSLMQIDTCAPSTVDWQQVNSRRLPSAKPHFYCKGYCLLSQL